MSDRELGLCFLLASVAFIGGYARKGEIRTSLQDLRLRLAFYLVQRLFDRDRDRERRLKK